PASYYFLVWVRLLRHHQLHPNPDHIAGQAVQLPDFCVPGTGADLLLRDLPQVVLRRDGVHLLADAIEVLLLPAHIGKTSLAFRAADTEPVALTELQDLHKGVLLVGSDRLRVHAVAAADVHQRAEPGIGNRLVIAVTVIFHS